MLHIYKIEQVDMISEDIETVIENEGRPLFDVFVKNVKHTNYFDKSSKFTEDLYEGGWPVMIKNNPDIGFCENDYCDFNWDITTPLLNRRVDRHFFIRINYNNKPKVGDFFTFLNQYDKRLTNDEITKVLDSIQDSEELTELCYEIGKDNKLHRVLDEDQTC